MEEGQMEMEAAAGMASSFWWLWLVTGILWVIISLVVLQFRTASITTVGIIIGIMFILAGIQAFAAAWLAEGWKWVWVIFGFLFVIAGVVSLASPHNTVTAFADVLGFLFLLVGVFWIIEAFAAKETNSLWWMSLIAGILMILIAFWTGSQFIVTKIYTLLAFAGIWALLHGITDMIKAFEIRKIGKMIAP
jgi:uncharacterized membrane protein HdeD (DUF308 family)